MHDSDKRNINALHGFIANSETIYPGGETTSMLGGRGGGGAWLQNLPLKFLLEPQILPSKI